MTQPPRVPGGDPSAAPANLALVFAPGLDIERTMPPIGIATLAGFLQAHGEPCELFDLNYELHDSVVSPRIEAGYRRHMEQLRTESFFQPELVAEYDFLSLQNLMYLASLMGQLPANGSKAAQSPLSVFLSDAAERLTRFTTVGVSVVFRSQVVPAVALLELLRRFSPRPTLVVGGPGVACFDFKALADVVVEGDGELRLLELVRGHRLPLGPRSEEACGEVSKGLALDDIPPPDYRELLAKYRYLTPSPILPLAITRGCYWGKCQFCSYGWGGKESGRATARYRRMSPEAVVAQMETLSRACGTAYFFFSADVADPALLSKIARQLIATHSHLEWTCDIRAEKQFANEKVARLFRESGCSLLYMGMESAAQPTLDRMDKGTRAELSREVVETMARSGVHVYPALFVGYPNETLSEAAVTLRYALEQGRRAVVPEPWIFSITPGSPVDVRSREGSLDGLRLIPGHAPIPERVSSIEEFLSTGASEAAYEKHGMSWRRTERLARIGLVNAMCDPDRWLFPAWRTDSGYMLLYAARHGGDELRHVCQTFPATWNVGKRVQALFQSSLVAGFTHFDADYQGLLECIEARSGTLVQARGGRRELLQGLRDVVRDFFESLDLEPTDLLLLTDILDHELHQALPCLSPDDELPIPVDGEAPSQEKQLVRFASDVAAFFAGVPFPDVRRDAPCAIEFGLWGRRVVERTPSSS